jgi:hypothetical protein
MAAIDKIYLVGSYDDYKTFVDWCDNQPVLYDKYNKPCKLSSYVYKHTEEGWIPGTVVFMGPYYLDAYLIRNCPFKFIQDELMLNYGYWSQERIKEYYEDVKNWDSSKGEYPYWATLDDFIVLDDGTMTIRGLEKSSYEKIKDGELYTSPKRHDYTYGKHFRCTKRPVYKYNTPFGCKRWFVVIDVPHDSMKYHSNHNSWDFYDEFVLCDWSSNTAYCKSIKALKRFMLKWKLPIGTIVKATDRYIGDDYEFVITK